jgi:hypothetical protein
MNSVFFPENLIRNARRQGRSDRWRADVVNNLVVAAAPWKAMDDNTLWELMFGATIKRSWMVWSNGFCPVCRKDVPMYNWIADPLARPWKMQCPHCKELFPKNDFAAFLRSGLDERHVFDPARADRKLLFNAEYPDPAHPKHRFGVDDGEGFVDGPNRWRFIGAYLIYGQWKQAIVGGVEKLAQAYVATGDKTYARKATILLDRVADLYPEHDFGKQGVMYEGPPRAGYVSTWHDACLETRSLALCWDMVRSGVAADSALCTFLQAKADQWRVGRSKRTPTDIAANIASGILRHAQEHQDRIVCNYPQTELTVAILGTVERGTLDGAEALFDPILPNMTAVDGITGEKGLTGYSTFSTQQLAQVISLYTRARPEFLGRLLRRHPGLAKTYRFHLDTWCDRTFHPRIGDCGAVGYPHKPYPAVLFPDQPGVMPATGPFLLQLSEYTGDPGYVQALWNAAGGKPDNIRTDILDADPQALRRTVSGWIRRHGPEPRQDSVLFKDWHLAILRPKPAPSRNTLWIDFDSGGYHSHADGGNIGLFAHGLDLLPDFGYPPVQFGGWESERARWYLHTAAHNTVVIDGKRQRNIGGPVTGRSGYEGLPGGKVLHWEVHPRLQAISIDGIGFDLDATRYERFLIQIQTGADTFAVVDSFRVVGGTDHARFLHGPLGMFETNGLRLAPGPAYGHGTFLSRFQTDPSPVAGWSASWTPDDRFKTRTPGPPVVLRCTDFTAGATASTCRAWVASEGITQPTEDTLPSLMVRRRGQPGLASHFACVLDVHRGQPGCWNLRRVDTGCPTDFLVGWDQPDGDRVWVWVRDAARSPAEILLPEGDRWSASGPLAAIAIPRRAPVHVLGGDPSTLQWNGKTLTKGLSRT